MNERGISKAVIQRLPRYYRHLSELLEENVERISSGKLSKRMRVTASQIRQDLNNFGGFGQQGYGYNVRFLRDEISKILGLDSPHDMVLVGCGNLGQALAKSASFEKNGFNFVGLFDIDPSLEGKKINKMSIRMVGDLSNFIKKNKVEIAVLALPKASAVGVAQILANSGIKAIWNFAQIDLHLQLPSTVTVENVHLTDSLMRLSYNLSNKK